MPEPIYTPDPFAQINSTLAQILLRRQQADQAEKELSLRKKQLEISQQEAAQRQQQADTQQQSALGSFMQAAQDPAMQQQLGPQIQAAQHDLGGANVPSNLALGQINALAMPQDNGSGRDTPSVIDQARQTVAMNSGMHDLIGSIDKFNLPPAVKEDSKNRVRFLANFEKMFGRAPTESELKQAAPMEADLIQLDTARNALKKAEEEGTANAAAMSVLKQTYPQLAKLPDSGFPDAGKTLMSMLDAERKANLAIYEAKKKQEISAQPTMKEGLGLFKDVFLARLNANSKVDPLADPDAVDGPAGASVTKAFNEAREVVRKMGYDTAVPGLANLLDKGSVTQNYIEQSVKQSGKFKVWLAQSADKTPAQKKQELIDAGWSPESAMRLLGPDK